MRARSRARVSLNLNLRFAGPPLVSARSLSPSVVFISSRSPCVPPPRCFPKPVQGVARTTEVHPSYSDSPQTPRRRARIVRLARRNARLRPASPAIRTFLANLTMTGHFPRAAVNSTYLERERKREGKIVSVVEISEFFDCGDRR